VSEALLVRLACWLMALAARLVPAADRDWVRAMEGECASLGCARSRILWSAGCLLAAARLCARSGAARFYALCLALLFILTIHDWNSADPTVTFVSLVFIPGALAFAEPERRWRIGLLFGSWLLLAHGLADFSAALRPHYQRLPLSPAELAEIALLAAITIPAAAIGARARIGTRRRPAD
jgi:hypothetical protein